MAFDRSSFQQKIGPLKKIQSENTGHMLLYEAILRLEERYSNRLGEQSNTAELIVKLVWWHHASNAPKCTTISNFASVLHKNELTDFAKIINVFMPPDNQLSERIDIVDLTTLAQSVVQEINSNDIYVYCQLDSQKRIGHKIVKIEFTDKVHPKLNKNFCDTIRELEWFIPQGYEAEKKFVELAQLNYKRYRKD